MLFCLWSDTWSAISNLLLKWGESRQTRTAERYNELPWRLDMSQPLQRLPLYVTRTAADACCHKTDRSRLCVKTDVSSCQAEERTEGEAVIKMAAHLNEINGGLVLGIEQGPCVCVFRIFENYRSFAPFQLLVYFQSAGKEPSTSFQPWNQEEQCGFDFCHVNGWSDWSDQIIFPGNPHFLIVIQWDGEDLLLLLLIFVPCDKTFLTGPLIPSFF